jgi:hypothetical protein
MPATLTVAGVAAVRLRVTISMLKELLTLEHAGWSALCDGTAGSFYREHMTPDGVMVVADGSVMTRDEVALALRSSPSWQSYEIDVPRMVRIGDDARALIYRGTGHREGEPPFVAMMTSVYVRDGEDWKLALYQQTPILADSV